MAVVAGIDEAGYGPKLGPLVLSAVAFRVRDEEVEGDLWKRLAGAVTGKTSRRGLKLVVTDSKKAYSRRTGIGVLEETVLAFAVTSGQYRTTLPELMKSLAGSEHERSYGYPWYAEQEVGIPVSGRALGAEGKAERLKKAMEEAGVEFLGARVLPVFEGTLNRQFAETDNKSETLWLNAAQLLARLRKRYGNEKLAVTVDKQGGRDRYGPLLGKKFPKSRFVIHSQGQAASHYELRGEGGGEPFHVSFVMKGEEHSLPVALASMHAKYVRELFMMVFSRYWGEKAPGVKSTAGYGLDASRFIEEIAGTVEKMGIDKRRLIRER